MWDSGAANSLPPATSLTGHMAKLTHIPLPSLELLKELLHISETSPSGLRWRNPRTNRLKPGDVAGSKNKRGYWMIEITTDKNYKYSAHRIVFYLQTNKDPGNKCVDHINGLKDPLSVRLATNSENQHNRNNNKNSSSKYKGVCWHKSNGKWYAQIVKNKKRIYLGVFKNEKDAAKAYNAAAAELFGEFAKLNVLE